MTNKNALENIVNILKTKRSFLIGAHVNPDGDSLGCVCAMGIALERLGKEVMLVSPDGVPEMYSFLPHSAEIESRVPSDVSFDVGVVLDCEDLSRLGPVEEAFKRCSTLIEIDHHPGRERDGMTQLVRPTAAAAGEIVLNLLRVAGMRIDDDIATCLLTAIITDTGSFRFSNVTPDTLRAAADLLECGASISEIAHHVYESRSASSIRLLGFALSSLKTTAGGRIAWASLSREQMAMCDASEAETEGLVNYVRSVRGARVGLLFRETPDGTTRVSLRSRDGSDISQVARLFGGGGHRMAAGCTIDRPLAEAEEIVIGAVRKWMGC